MLFSNCTSLTKITIPASVEHLGNGNNYGPFAFSGIEEIIFEEGNLSYIGWGTFANCYNLTSITLPDTVIKMRSFTFVNCRELKNVILSNNLEIIESGVFYNCSSL